MSEQCEPMTDQTCVEHALSKLCDEVANISYEVELMKVDLDSLSYGMTSRAQLSTEELDYLIDDI